MTTPLMEGGREAGRHSPSTEVNDRLYFNFRMFSLDIPLCYIYYKVIYYAINKPNPLGTTKI